MNKTLSGLIDYFALMNLHRERSLKTHFSMNQIPSIEFKDFYKKPSIPEIDFKPTEIKNIYRYKFRSEVENSKCNDYVEGLYYRNSSQTVSKSIILVHGWRMKDYSTISNIYLKGFLENGYDVYFISLPYHCFRQGNESIYSGELMISADIGRTLVSIKQAVSDIRALINYLKNNKQKVVLAGISLGGFITNLTTTVEKNIDMLISAFYANSMPFSIWNSIPGKYVKKDFVDNSYTYEKLKENWDIFNPSLRLPLISKENILLFSGLYDKFVLSEDTDQLWEAWGRPKRIKYEIGHAGLVIYKRKILKDTISFVKQRSL